MKDNKLLQILQKHKIPCKVYLEIKKRIGDAGGVAATGCADSEADKDQQAERQRSGKCNQCDDGYVYHNGYQVHQLCMHCDGTGRVASRAALIPTVEADAGKTMAALYDELDSWKVKAEQCRDMAANARFADEPILATTYEANADNYMKKRNLLASLLPSRKTIDERLRIKRL